jgi:GT2 family glycosyltransferase
MTVDVVIPVHGKWELTRRCLDSLVERDACIRRVIVVDDASPDDTAYQLRHRGDVTSIFLDENAGFARASNAGLNRSDADAVLFLNNDTIVPRGSIAALAAALEADPTIGAVGPKLLYADGTVQSAGCTFAAGLIGAWRLYAHLDGSIREANVAGDYPVLTAAALLVRGTLARSLRGFDESYHNGVEDIDLCMRIWRSGARVRYEPASTIYHVEGASRGKAHDDDANLALLASRWSAAFGAIPPFYPRAAAAVILDWRPRTPIEQLAFARLCETLRSYAGARVTVNGSAFVARVRAQLEQRGSITLTYEQTHGVPHLCCAAAHGDGQVWVPSVAAREQLRERGVAPERIAIVRAGFAAGARADRNGAPAIVIDDPRQSAIAAEIARALEPSRASIVDVTTLDAASLALLRSAPLVVFAGTGDAWGLAGGECLAAGAAVVAQSGAPFLDVLPDDAAVVAEPGALADAAAGLRSDPQRTAAIGERARKEMTLRVPPIYAGERMRELARAAAYGIPAGDAFTLDAERIERLRQALR